MSTRWRRRDERLHGRLAHVGRGCDVQVDRPGDPRRHNLKLQGEYLDRTEDGSLAFDIDGRAR